MGDSSSGRLKAAKAEAAKKHPSGVRKSTPLEPLELGKREKVPAKPALDAAAEAIKEAGGDLSAEELELLLRGYTFVDE